MKQFIKSWSEILSRAKANKRQSKWHFGISPPCPPSKKLAQIPKENLKQFATDKLSWMQDPIFREDVLRYLKNEKKYYSEVMYQHEIATLYQAIFDDIDRHIPNEEEEVFSDVQECIDGYAYYTRNVPGKNHPVYYRKWILNQEGNENELLEHEEIVLDKNLLCSDGYVDCGMIRVSNDHLLLAYTLDTTASEVYDVYIKNLRSRNNDTFKEYVECILSGVVSIEWLENDDTHDENKYRLVYTVVDKLGRPYEVRLLSLDCSGRCLKDVQVLYTERDPAFHVDLARSKDKKYVFIMTSSKNTTETHLISSHLSNNRISTVCFRPRQEDVQYFVEHRNGHFLIVTNEDCINYKIIQIPVKSVISKSQGLTSPVLHSTASEDEEVIIPCREEQLIIEEFDVFQDFLVTYERHWGLPRIRVQSHIESDQFHFIPLPFSIGTVRPEPNQNALSCNARFTFSSPLIPTKTMEYNMTTSELCTLKQDQYIDIDPNQLKQDYECYQIHAPSLSCTSSSSLDKIPVTLVHHKGIPRDSTAPCLLLVYGAYGAPLETAFELPRVSLLKRGWIIAFAHIRGGGELGPHWHSAGRLTKKEQSANDCIAVAEHLIKLKYTSSQKLCASTASAGGVCLGIVANKRPDLFKAMSLKVPFVDVMSSMLDQNLPLTEHEYDEWGNPSIDETCAKNMAMYDPYRNIPHVPINSPHLHITTAINDPRVPFWGPTKYTARLRSTNTFNNVCDDNVCGRRLILLDSDFDGGHFSPTGPHTAEVSSFANEYAFFLYCSSL